MLLKFCGNQDICQFDIVKSNQNVNDFSKTLLNQATTKTKPARYFNNFIYTLVSVPYLGFLVFVCVATARAASFLPLF